FEFLNLGYAAYLDFFNYCKQAFPDIPDQAIAKMVQGIEMELFRPDEELKALAKRAIQLGITEQQRLPICGFARTISMSRSRSTMPSGCWKSTRRQMGWSCASRYCSTTSAGIRSTKGTSSPKASARTGNSPTSATCMRITYWASCTPRPDSESLARTWRVPVGCC